MTRHKQPYHLDLHPDPRPQASLRNMNQTQIFPTQRQRVRQQRNEQLRRRRPRPQLEDNCNMRKHLQLDRKTIFDHLSAVSWAMLTPVRQNFSTRSGKRTSRKAKLVVSRSRLGPHTSQSMLWKRRHRSSTKMDLSNSTSLVSWLSILLVTSPLPTYDLEDPLYVTSLSLLLTLCTVLSPRPWNP